MACFASALADTLSSEFGQLTGQAPRLITTGEVVPTGTDGGITWAGTGVGVLGAALLSLEGRFLDLTPVRATLPILLAGLSGNLLDSWLGATLQRRGWLSNETVNFANTCGGAALGYPGLLRHGLAPRRARLLGAPRADEALHLMAPLLQGFQAFLRSAAAAPSPWQLLAAWLGVGLAPLALVVPMTAVCLAAAVLPAGWAALVILGGVALNTALSWGLARTLFGRRLEAWLESRGGRLGAVREGARREPLKWAILSRFLPVPFSAVPMALASTGVGLGTAVLGSLIGMAPWTCVYIRVVRAGREGSVAAIGQAVTAVALLWILMAWARRRLAGGPAAEPAPAAPAEPLKPRRAGAPLVTLLTLPDQGPSLEARARAGRLAGAPGF